VNALSRWFRGGPKDPPPDPDPSLIALLADGGLAAYDRQLAFASIVGDRDWLLDQETKVLQLGDDLWLPASDLGSVAESAGTWLWAWANESVAPDMRTDAERARQIGSDRGLDLLTTPEVDVARIIDGHLLALAISGLLDADAYYRCPYRRGAAYVTVKLSSVRAAPDRVGRHLGELVRQALVDLPYVVSRASIESYVGKLEVPASINGDRIVVEDGPTFTFDDHGFLTVLDETITP
jgi:hypothetical protein